MTEIAGCAGAKPDVVYEYRKDVLLYAVIVLSSEPDAQRRGAQAKRRSRAECEGLTRPGHSFRSGSMAAHGRYR